MSIWDAVVGQPHAVELLTACARRPVHAYLFVGPPGCTKSEAARAFAALLLDPSGDPTSRTARLALAGKHPDVHEVRRVGAAISAEQADEIVRLAARPPLEADRKVLILHELHLLGAGVAPKLLKTVEEPTDSTVFVILADDVPPELGTIASRCVRVDFRPIEPSDIEAALLREGVPPDVAAEAALAAGGDLDRASLLASDPDLVARRRAFLELPRRLDGTGATVHALVVELLELIDRAMAPLTARHAEEMARLDEHVRAFGARGSGRRDVEARHRREIRRFRTNELRAGLAVVARAYRDALVAAPGHRPDALVRAVHDIHEVMGHLDRNPNEVLQLQHLLLRLPSLP